MNPGPKMLTAAVLAACLLSQTAALAQDRGPANWRDPRPELRQTWDSLEGKPAPPLTPLGEWINSDARSWRDLEGKVVVLDYRATWCGPCIRAIPQLVQLHEEHHDDGLVILGVHSSRGWQNMANFVEQRSLPYAFAADPESRLGRELGIRFIPTYFVIDRAGRMRVAGADRRHLEGIVRTLLKEPSPQRSAWPAPVEKELYAKDLRGQKAPEFTVAEWLGPRPYTEGKVVLVDFWATWCKPCREAIPHMNRLHEKFGDDLAVIGISDEPAATVRAFMDDNEMAYPQAIDEQARMKSAVGVLGIPHVLVISTDGVVRWQGYPMDPAEPLTDELIARIIDADPGVAARRQAERRKARSGP